MSHRREAEQAVTAAMDSHNPLNLNERRQFLFDEQTEWLSFCFRTTNEAKKNLPNRTHRRLLSTIDQIIRNAGFAALESLGKFLAAGGLVLLSLGVSTQGVGLAIGAALVAAVGISSIMLLRQHSDQVQEIVDILMQAQQEFDELHLPLNKKKRKTDPKHIPDENVLKPIYLEELFWQTVRRIVTEVFDARSTICSVRLSEVRQLLEAIQNQQFVLSEENLLFGNDEKSNDWMDDEDFQFDIIDPDLPVNPMCICGTKMIPKTAGDAYVGMYTICDECDERIRDANEIFHCPRSLEANMQHLHPIGYDICLGCARNKKDDLVRYRALIVQNRFGDMDQRFDLTNNDGEALFQFFTEHRYNEVELISFKAHKKSINGQIESEEDGVTMSKEMILTKLKAIQDTNINDVVVVCWFGHGYEDESQLCVELENREILRSNQIVQTLFIDDAKEEGYNYIMNGTQTRTFLLFNTCHSGAFSTMRESDEPDYKEDKILLEDMTRGEVGMDEYLRLRSNDSTSAVVVSSCGDAETTPSLLKRYKGYFVSPLFAYFMESVRSGVVMTDDIFDRIENATQREDDFANGLRVAVAELEANVRRSGIRGVATNFRVVR